MTDATHEEDLAYLERRRLRSLVECWHLDCYRRDDDGGAWRVRWSQATSINNA